MTSTVFNDIRPNVPYTAPVRETTPIAVKEALPASSVSVADTVELSKKEKKEKKGLIAGTKEFIANFKKFFATVGIYTKGTLKGIGVGAVAGISVFGVTELANTILRKAAHGKKNVLGIVLGSVAALGALASNLWTASLDATEKQAEIDHRYIGHKN